MAAQIVVTVYKVHEARSIVSADETELLIGHLFIRGDIDGVVIIGVVVDIISHDERGVVTATPGLIDQAVVVAALVMDRSVGNDTVRSDIL